MSVGRKASIADRVKELRREMRVNQGEFGMMFGVDQTVVSKWEKGSELPAAKQLIRLGNFARERSDKELFWEAAELDLDAFDQLADWRAKARKRMGNMVGRTIVSVPLLERTAGAEISFLDWQVPVGRTLSVRSHLLRSSEKSFAIGNAVYDAPEWPSANDVLLLDPTTTDLRDISEHEFIAVRIQDGKSFHDYAGTLVKVIETDHTQYRMWMRSESIYLGLSVHGPKPSPIKLPGLDSRVLGRVITWVRRQEKK